MRDEVNEKFDLIRKALAEHGVQFQQSDHACARAKHGRLELSLLVHIGSADENLASSNPVLELCLSDSRTHQCCGFGFNVRSDNSSWTFALSDSQSLLKINKAFKTFAPERDSLLTDQDVLHQIPKMAEVLIQGI